MRRIVAIGGLSEFSGENGRKLHEYLLGLSAKSRPNVCFIPTASGEAHARVIEFYDVFTSLPCKPSWLSLFSLPTGDLSGFIEGQDIIFVGGGNTRSMLALWREWGLDTILRKAYENGTVLAGSSAGANCWFEQCSTDSIPGDLTVLQCLGFLEGSFTPHYDIEPKRKPMLHKMLTNGEIRPGYAADNDTALHFADGKVAEAVSARAGALAYRAYLEDGTVNEEPLTVKRL